MINRVFACMLTVGMLSFAQTSSAARPYIDLCGVVTVDGVPTENVMIQAFRCSDDSLVTPVNGGQDGVITGPLVDGFNYPPDGYPA